MCPTHKLISATGQAAAEAGHEDVVAVLSEAGAPLRPRTACARRTETDDALGRGTPPREFEQLKRIFRYCRTKNGYGTSSDVKNRCTQYMPMYHGYGFRHCTNHEEIHQISIDALADKGEGDRGVRGVNST